MQDTPFQRTKEMLEIAHTEDTVFPPTELYNEGWMLRLALLCQSEGNECLPFALQPKASQYSEALISSPFLPRFQGDSLAKGHTNVDGVVGHLEFRFGTKARLMVRGDATQLMIIREKVKRRISAYSEDETKHDELKTWYEHSFLRALHDADIRCISWESVIDNTNETSIRDFQE